MVRAYAASRVTYLLEPDNRDAEVWLLDNPNGTRVTLQCGKKSVSFDRSVASGIVDDRIDEISPETAREKLPACRCFPSGGFRDRACSFPGRLL